MPTKVYSNEVGMFVKDLESITGRILTGMTGEDRGKTLYFAMKRVMSKVAKKVRKQVVASDLDVTAAQVRDAVWSYANGVSGIAGVKVKPGRGRNKKKGQVPIKRVPGWRLPILMWAYDGTQARITKKLSKKSKEPMWRGAMKPNKYEFLKNRESLEAEAAANLPKEVNNLVDKWVEKQLQKI